MSDQTQQAGDTKAALRDGFNKLMAALGTRDTAAADRDSAAADLDAAKARLATATTAQDGAAAGLKTAKDEFIAVVETL